MTAYDVIQTPAGPCTVVVRRRGRVCALHLGRKRGIPGRLRRLPEVRRWIALWFAGRPIRVPLDLEWATPFERRVYRALRRVSRGKTLRYGDLARKAGRPGAARAVGRAMARNRICLFIP